jgi:Tol biopolymer transport system component
VRPDGGQIAFATGNDIMTDRGHRAIWVPTASGAVTPLVSDDNRSPRWSPDGQRLAYVSAAQRAKPCAVRRPRRAGGGVEEPRTTSPGRRRQVAGLTMLIPDEASPGR